MQLCEVRGRYLVAVDAPVAVLAVVFYVGEHRVARVGAEVHDHLVRAAVDKVQVEVVVVELFLCLRRGLEVVGVPVVEDAVEGLFGAVVRELLVEPDVFVQVLEERQFLELYLVVDAALGLEAAPVAEAVEEVRTAALRLGLDGVKAAAYAVIELLLPQRAYCLLYTSPSPRDA